MPTNKKELKQPKPKLLLDLKLRPELLLIKNRL